MVFHEPFLSTVYCVVSGLVSYENKLKFSPGLDMYKLDALT